MNGIHDLGGMHGFGPIHPEADEPVFHEAWEGRVFAMNLAAPPELEPRDGFRYTIERMDPAQYLAASYYERWLVVMETAAVEAGLVTQDELAARAASFREHAAAPVPRREEPAQIAGMLTRLHEPHPLPRPNGVAPRFREGDAVRARNIHPTGHTRLPRYVRGRRGTIARLHGIHDFPDTPTDGLPSPPQAVYSVRFAARELWGASGDAHADVYLDLWDSYLETDPTLAEAEARESAGGSAHEH